MARGRIDTLADARSIVARSFPVIIYEPRDPAAWTDARAGSPGSSGNRNEPASVVESMC